MRRWTVLVAGFVHTAFAAWIRKEAEIAANGEARTASQEDPDDEEAIWRLIRAAADADRTADHITSIGRSSTDDVIIEPTDGSKAVPVVAENGLTNDLTSVVKAQVPKRIRETAFHPTKGGNANHSGYSPYLGLADISFPSWTFLHPEVQPKGFRTAASRVFHGSPLIDADSNVYIQSTSGWIFSLTKDGSLRWSFDLNSEDPQNPSNMAPGWRNQPIP